MSLKRALSYAVCLACSGVAVGGMWAQNPMREVVLHNFANPYPPQGAQPSAPLLRDSAGNLYGTATKGGAYGNGVVFKVDASGVLTVLHTFTGGADGGRPQAGLISDSAGNLYGTAFMGGLHGEGVVYRVNASGETVLHHFGGSDGSYPLAGVITDGAGNLYGTASTGGAHGWGAVYKLNASGETVLYSFTGGSDGSVPRSGVIRDSTGNLYGTTQYGGNGGVNYGGYGVVYKLDPSGNETVLYAFTDGSDGANPDAGVVRDPAGNLYGTTVNGGESSSCCGVLYKLSPSGQETPLHLFTGGSDGSVPVGGLAGDSAGNLYGTAFSGGGGNGGVVYKIGPTGFQTLYSFTSPSAGQASDGGCYPRAAPILDSSGNLYGTASSGGFNAMGVVFRIDPSGNETVLAGFPSPADGANPTGTLAHDAAGNLYGATILGGEFFQGTVFKLDTTGHETVLYTFTGGSDGGQPYGGVTVDALGNIYGTASRGGAFGLGVVWKIDALGNWTVLHSFKGGADGGRPVAGVAVDQAGNLYGTTPGGAFSSPGASGTVFKVDPNGLLTTLYSFTTPADGSNPQAGVILDSAGNLYGTTLSGGNRLGAGVVYKLDPSGQETVLYTFQGGSDGGMPMAGLIRDSPGNLYGTASRYGSGGAGVAFKLDPSGHETVMYAFPGGAGGSTPNSGLTADPAGNLYGTTSAGGTGNAGVVYELNASGQTVLYNFSAKSDGGYPYGGVLTDAAGNLYGTTKGGGAAGGGVVFALVH